MSNINDELAKYLKNKNGLKRLMINLRDKYIALSRPSGTITISNIGAEESVDIGNLLGRKIIVGDSLKTSFKEITKKINEGKYNGFDWPKLFNSYFNDKIITKKEYELNYLDSEDKYYMALYQDNIDKEYTEYLFELIKHDEFIGKIVKQRYNSNKNKLKDEINNILLLLDNIPTSPTTLAVYSSITGNPHYLDFNKSTSTLFFRVLARIKNIEYEDKTEIKINILSEINVYIDSISNFVITYKLTGNNILNQLNEINEVVNLNLLNIKGLDKVSTEDNVVYVFENPSLLISMLDLKVPIIITSGMPNVSLYILLKKLIESGTKIYYNGDFDPEGLLIAEKLKLRFSNIELFCYDEQDYLNSKSGELLSSSRLKKLDNINSKELLNIKKILLEEKISGYQEQNLNRLREYIINNKKSEV